MTDLKFIHHPRDVKRKILIINDTLDKVEILRNELLTVVHDTYTTDIKLEVVGLLLGVKEVKGCPMRNKKDTLNSSSPSTKKCFRFKCSSQSLVRLL